MTRIQEFANSYIEIVKLEKLDKDNQFDLLTEMIRDLLLEDRLRFINILDISGYKLTDNLKKLILKGA